MAIRYLAVITMLLLTACGGSGGGSGATPGTSGAPASAAASKFFVVDEANSAVASVANSNPSPGTMAVDRIIVGHNTGIGGAGVRAVAYDPTGNLLYVANGSSILVFDNASTSSGNVGPARTITSPEITSIEGMALDVTNNVLYVAIYGNGAPNDKILVFNSANSANGSLNSDRAISVTWNAGSFVITGIAVDPVRDVLYVAGYGVTPTFNNVLLAYDHVSSLNGPATAYSRSITFGLNTFLWGLCIDSTSNRLFVASFSDQNVMVFDNANSATSLASLSRTLNFGANIRYLALDSANDRLYSTTATGVYIVSSASTASGGVSATYVIAPTGSTLGAASVTP